MHKLLSPHMVCGGFWSGFGEVFGSRNTSKMFPKMVCKNCLNLDTILDEIGDYFDSLFRLRMGGPGENFRFRSVSLLGFRFDTAQLGPQSRFLEDFNLF